MKTGSDLTELQAFRNHTSHTQSCLNSDCLLFGREAVKACVLIQFCPQIWAGNAARTGGWEDSGSMPCPSDWFLRVSSRPEAGASQGISLTAYVASQEVPVFCLKVVKKNKRWISNYKGKQKVKAALGQGVGLGRTVWLGDWFMRQQSARACRKGLGSPSYHLTARQCDFLIWFKHWRWASGSLFFNLVIHFCTCRIPVVYCGLSFGFQSIRIRRCIKLVSQLMLSASRMSCS